MGRWQSYVEGAFRGALRALGLPDPVVGLVSEAASRANRGEPDDARARRETGLALASDELGPADQLAVEDLASLACRAVLTDVERVAASREAADLAALAEPDRLERAQRFCFKLLRALVRNDRLAARLCGVASGLALRDEQSGAFVPCPVGKTVRVGRKDEGASVDLACDDDHVSRLHCEVHGEKDRLRIQDRSRFGTFVNGKKVEGEGAARAGDRIVLGHAYALSVVDPARRGVHPMSAPTMARLWNQLVADEPERRSRIGRFEIVRELGRGGMGIVYEAHDTERRRPCALKVLAEAHGTTPDLVERFKREATLGGRLAAVEGIVSMDDAGAVPETGELWGVMTLVSGASLAGRMRSGLALVEGVRILARVARALARAHERGIVHRDVKPENVLVSEDGAPFVTDFGLAKALDDVAGLTATGTAMGTLNYVAPEQLADSKRVGPPADVYGLGGILYLLLAGRVPYVAETSRELYELVTAGALVPPRVVNEKAPRALDELCVRTLARDPGRRPSAEAFAVELETWLALHAAETRLDAPGLRSP